MEALKQTRRRGLQAFAAMLVLGVGISAGGCSRDDSRRDTPARVAVRDTSARSARGTSESPGEVAEASVPAAREHWITDANMISLLAAMNARQIAAADAELEAWHSDTVRAFAAAMAREHAELQHSADSLSARLGLTPVSSALAKPWMAAMQAEIDSMQAARGDAFDRAYVRQQIASHRLMGDYVAQLAAAAEHPELQTFLENVRTRVAAELGRAQALNATLAAADSAAAARAAARKHRSATP